MSDNLGIMNWYDAKIYCKKLGAEWRLPTKDELNMLYENKEEIGGFSNKFFYWSSTEYDFSSAWKQIFLNGCQLYSNKLSNNYVRAVRAS